jgi:heterodisulfide reductase subunit C2
MLRLKGHATEKEFLDEVIERSGQDLLRCLQCGKCSGGCPITSETVGGPRRLIARILGGMKEEALRDPTFWYCVSCGTCATRCPVEINTYALSTTLCEMAAEEGIEPSEPGIHLFEEICLKSIEKNGRIREINAALAFNMRSLRPWADADIGTKMMLKGAFSPLSILHRNHSNKKITEIFDKIKQKQQQKA